MFRNEASFPINVYWIDFSGKIDDDPWTEEIAAGDEIIVDTFDTYPFTFRKSPDDGTKLLAYSNGVSGEVYEGRTFGAQEGSDQIVVIKEEEDGIIFV